MSPTNLTNGATDDLFYPADYPAEMQLDTMRSADRQALRARLAELRELPPEQWAEHDATELSPQLPGTYMVFFGEDGLAWVAPQAGGRFRVDGLGSQKKLEALRQQAAVGDTDEGV